VRYEAHYQLHDQMSNTLLQRPVHASLLVVTFRYDSARTSPLDVARRDLQKYFENDKFNSRYKAGGEHAPATRSSWLVVRRRFRRE
jgi:hypothetical protein